MPLVCCVEAVIIPVLTCLNVISRTFASLVLKGVPGPIVLSLEPCLCLPQTLSPSQQVNNISLTNCCRGNLVQSIPPQIRLLMLAKRGIWRFPLDSII